MTYFDIHLVGFKNKSLVVSEVTRIDFIKKKLDKSPDNLEIIYRGQLLEDSQTIGDYDIGEDAVLYYHTLNINHKKTYETVNNQLNQIVNIFQGLLNLSVEQNATEEANYEAELEQLNAMGFTDTDAMVNLLNLYGGNVEAVANVLLGV